MATELLALPFGIAVGVLLGLVGGGGSILAVPILVYVLGQPVHAATTESLFIVGIAALAGTAGHARAGNLSATTALTFGIAGAAGALGGTALNQHVGDTAILLAFAALLLLAAAALQRTPATADRQNQHRWPHVRATAAGLGTGVLTGFIGVGGGFVIVPALVLFLGVTIRRAIGTSLAIIALTSAAALAAHLASGQIAWGITIAFAATAIAGALLGGRLSTHFNQQRLRSIFATALAVVALLLILETVTALV